MQRFRIAAVLALGLAVLAAGAWMRGAEYDEGYTLLLTAGRRLPDWPSTPSTAAEGVAQLTGPWSFGQIAHDLRTGDVHPPLYFWAAAMWRDVAGQGLFALRMLSALLGAIALALVGGIARRCAVPAAPAMLMTLGCYGFAYTSMVARGFALAEALTLAGVATLLGGRRPFAAGLLLGAATSANYLAAFAAGAAVAWAVWRGRWRTALGFAPWLALDLFFFLAQRGSRDGQFPPFALGPGLLRLARYMAADLFGGLPLYAGAAGPAVAVAAAALCAALVWAVARRWNPAPDRMLLAMCVAAPPIGLIALGFVFGNTPIELRYLAFSAPFAALLLAGAGLARPLFATVLTVQAASIAGLLTRPETMQPQARAAHDAAPFAGLALVPRGNDGVGVAVAFVAGADPAQRVLVVPRGMAPEAIRALIADEPRVTVAWLGLDDDSRATLPALRAALSGTDWRDIAGFHDISVLERDAAPRRLAVSPSSN